MFDVTLLRVLNVIMTLIDKLAKVAAMALEVSMTLEI